MEYYDSGSATGMGFLIVVYIAVIIFLVACYWKIFTKAGKPGWAAIVPIYNIIVLLEIVNKPVWWIVLLLIPCVNLVVMVLVIIELAKVFGKSTGFAVGLLLLGIIFLPILAFGDAEYQG
jgi:hypothetical protein